MQKTNANVETQNTNSTYKFCKYCGCLIMLSGKCRNKQCIMGKDNMATEAQKDYIIRLCEELEVDIEGKDPNKLTKAKADKLIKDLIARKAFKELYGSEE